MSDTSTDREPELADDEVGAHDAQPVDDPAPDADEPTAAGDDRAPAEDDEALEGADEDGDGPAASDADADADSDDEPQASADGDDGDQEIDDEVAPPVIGCLRCDARVALGSRYCPRCGTPLVRSGEDAANRLSRTRRNAPVGIRLLVPLLVAAIVAAVVWLAVVNNPDAGFRDDVEAQLSRAVDANRELSSQLLRLRPGGDGGLALTAAEQATTELSAAARELEQLDVPSSETARFTRASNALAADRTYVATVLAVLRDPKSSELGQLGSRSARAAAALATVDDITPAAKAIDGTRELGRYARAPKARKQGGSGSATAAGSKGSPFLTTLDQRLSAERAAFPRTKRGFALLRAARDGVASFSGPGPRPADAAAAVREARELFTSIAADRTAGAARARALPTRNANQQGIVERLGAAYQASAATATTLAQCLGSGDPKAAASRCLQQVRARSTAERAAQQAFLTAVAPGRKAAGLAPLSPDL